MSQLLAPRINLNKTILFQDLYFVKKQVSVNSGIQEVSCSICGKSVDEGMSVTAKKIGQKMSFFCQYHLPKDF